MTSKAKPFWILTLILCAVVISGCSRLTLSYRFADWYLVYKLDDSFDLNRDQKKFIDKEFEKYLSWNKQVMIPKYKTYLEQLHEKIQKGNLNEATWAPEYNKMDQLFKESIAPLLPPFAELMLKLNKQQVSYFKNTLEEERQKIKDNYATPGKRLKKSLKRNEKVFKFWFGRLNPQQEVALKDIYVQNPFPSDLWQLKRAQQQDYYLKLLNESPMSKEKLLKFFRSYVYQKGQTPEEIKYNKLFNEYRLTVFKKLVSVLNSLTDKQKQRFTKKVNHFSEDFETLFNSTVKN